MDAGVSLSVFWELSIAEVNDLLASSRRRMEAAYKESVRHCFDLAQMVENIAARILDKKAVRLYPWDLYPELFTGEKKNFAMSREQEEFEAFKERRREAMDRYNRARKGRRNE